MSGLSAMFAAAPTLAEISFEQRFSRFLADPNVALVDIDREIVRREGLAGFIRLAWHTVENEGSYKSNWHIHAVAEHLEAASEGQIQRLAIMCPPRHMKSILTAVMWPAYDWIRNPWRRFLFSSYAHSLSIRDSVRCRRVIASPWFKARWGDCFQLTGDQNTKIRFDNDKNGYRISTSVGGAITGEGGDIVCCDDANNALRADSPTVRENTLKWWDESMSTRLSNPEKGVFVIIQQRLHEQDLIGHVLGKHGVVQRGGEYYVLCLPVEYEPDHPHRWFRDPRKEAGELLWPSHMNQRIINALKLALGPYAAAGQLQQRPTAREGGYFKRSWFRMVATAAADTEWVRSWDRAASEKKLTKTDPDYTASVLIGFSPSRQHWIIADVERFREGPGEVNKRMLRTAENDRAKYGYVRIVAPQDPGQAGKDQAQAMAILLSAFSLEIRPVTGNKVERATPLAGQAELGMVEILDTSHIEGEDNWNRFFLDEMCAFPTGSHDDMVDAATSGFNSLTGGTNGLLDYYSRMLREREEEDAKLAGQPLPDYRVVTGQTNDIGQAATTTAQRLPPRS